MKRRCVLRPQADLDIDKLAEFIAQTDVTAGLRFLDEVLSTLKSLAASPSLGSPCEFPSPRYKYLKFWPVRTFKNHFVFFQPISDGIEVVRVLHGAQDYWTILGE